MAKRIYSSIADLVGRTPLLSLGEFSRQKKLDVPIVAKVEYFNPAGSQKDRIALGMIERAEKDPSFDPKKTTLVETTSGNTGIALAALCAAKGYKLRIYIQDVVSIERRQVIKAYGADLVLFSQVPEAVKVLKETNGDFVAATAAIKKMAAKEKDAILLNQMQNPANPESHFKTTGREIWKDTGGDIDVLVASVGTGGTLSGAGRFLKNKKPDMHVVAVQPRADETDITGVHRFSDVPSDHFPANLDRSVYDEVLTASAKDAYAASRLVAKTDGLLVGPSAGAALWAAAKVAKRPDFAGKTVVAILPDTGLRYLSTSLFEA